MAFYRATGQAHKPAPPLNTGKNTAVNKSGPGGQVRLWLTNQRPSWH